MKRRFIFASLIAVLASSIAAYGQMSITLTGPATVKQGKAISLNLNLANPTAVSPAGLQWTLAPPTGATVQTITAGSASTTAGKVVACNTSNLLCIVYGPNQNVIAAGQVVVIQATIPANSVPGPNQFTLTGLLAGDKSGQPTTIASGPVYSVTVLSLADINGDGTVNAADISAMATQVTSGVCTDDQNGDGICNLFDVLAVVLRSLGL